MPCSANLHVQIELFYVSQNHQLSSSITSGSTGAWQNDGSLTKYSTAPNTRSLSVTSNLQAISNAPGENHSSEYNWSDTTTMVVLFYESPNGSVAVLSRVAKGCSGDSCPYVGSVENPLYTGDVRNSSWIDESPTLREACDNRPYPSICQYGPPFASSQYAESTNFSVILKYLLWQSETTPSASSVLKTASYTPLKNSEDSDVQVLRKY